MVPPEVEGKIPSPMCHVRAPTPPLEKSFGMRMQKSLRAVKKKRKKDTPCRHRWRRVTVLRSNGGAPHCLDPPKSTKNVCRSRRT